MNHIHYTQYNTYSHFYQIYKQVADIPLMLHLTYVHNKIHSLNKYTMIRIVEFLANNHSYMYSPWHPHHQYIAPCLEHKRVQSPL